MGELIGMFNKDNTKMENYLIVNHKKQIAKIVKSGSQLEALIHTYRMYDNRYHKYGGMSNRLMNSYFKRCGVR